MPSLRHFLAIPAVLLAATFIRAAESPAAIDRANFHAALSGSWQGTLEYRDYQDPEKRVILPTLLEAESSADHSAFLLAFTYDDGPSKKVRTTDILTLDPLARTLDWFWGYGKNTTRGQLNAESKPGHLVLVGPGEDGDRPAQIRLTLDYTATAIFILKEISVEGAPFAFRHRYTLTRRTSTQP